MFVVLHFDNVEPLIVRPLFILALPLLEVSFCHESLVLLVVIATVWSHINVLMLRVGLQRLSTQLVRERRRLSYAITLIMSGVGHVGVIVSNIRIATICSLKLLILHDDL